MSAQYEARPMHKYVDVNWKARTPYAKDNEAIQPIVRQAHAQEQY